jgi:hypothetical protein
VAKVRRDLNISVLFVQLKLLIVYTCYCVCCAHWCSLLVQLCGKTCKTNTAQVHALHSWRVPDVVFPGFLGLFLAVSATSKQRSATNKQRKAGKPTSGDAPAVNRTACCCVAGVTSSWRECAFGPADERRFYMITCVCDAHLHTTRMCIPLLFLACVTLSVIFLFSAAYVAVSAPQAVLLYGWCDQQLASVRLGPANARCIHLISCAFVTNQLYITRMCVSLPSLPVSPHLLPC